MYSVIAKTVFENEINCLVNIEKAIGFQFDDFVSELDRCKGSIIWMGIGKSGHICKKIVATMQSLGIKSLFLHPSEALHGDLGLVSSEDIVIAVSKSGETREIIETSMSIKNKNAKLFSIVGRNNSSLERFSDKCLVLNVGTEAFLEIVPTTSTTATLVIGDAIAVSIAQKRGFTKEDFGRLHPEGQLGKRLTLRIRDVMIAGDDNSVVLEGSNLEQVVFEMCRKPVGCVCIVDKMGKLKGLFTDGDLRRYLNSGRTELKKTVVDDVMTNRPIVLNPNQLLYDAIEEVISKNSVSVYPVVDKDGRSIGTLRTVDVIKTGLIS